MLLAFPFDSLSILFRRRRAGKMLKLLAEERRVTAAYLANGAGVSAKTAWAFLKDLEKTEHVKRGKKFFESTEMVHDDCIIINLRDVRSGILFKHKVTPSLLYLLLTREEITFREASKYLATSYRTVRRATSLLRRSGVMLGDRPRAELLKEVDDPCDLIPRRAHREAVRHFLHVVESQYPRFIEPIILYGDASWGKETLFIDILALSRVAYPPERLLEFARGLASASANIAYHFGATMNVVFSTEDAFLAQRLGFVSNPHPIIDSALNGICVHGKLPTAEDYFDLMNQVLHYSPERIKELVEKGYITEREGRLVYTEKAFESWKRSKQSTLFEQVMSVNGKSMKVIGIEPPSDPRA